jgi:prepilin-type N-terminal cleavage/methylation domain-containing protein
MKTNRRIRGYSLLELLIALAIIGMVIAIAIPSVMKCIKTIRHLFK